MLHCAIALIVPTDNVVILSVFMIIVIALSVVMLCIIFTKFDIGANVVAPNQEAREGESKTLESPVYLFSSLAAESY